MKPRFVTVGRRQIGIGDAVLPTDFEALIVRFIAAWVAEFGRFTWTNACDLTAVPIDDGAARWQLVHEALGLPTDPPAMIALSDLISRYRMPDDAPTSGSVEVG